MKNWLRAVQQQLSQQIINDKLPHAILFSGVKGAGHEEIAQWLIKVLLCQQPIHENSSEALLSLQSCNKCKTCKLFASNSYPDHLTVVNEKNTIGVDLIRQLSQFFQRTAHIGHAKSALVNNADTMTVSAANALLKTLEEPTTDSFIILTTDRSDMLLPTIISRCQKIEIRPPVGDKLLAEFNHQGDDAFINLSHLNELTDSDAEIAFAEFRDMVQYYLCENQHRNKVLATLVNNDDGFRWLEKVLVDLMRKHWGWQISTNQNQYIISINREQIWQVYNLVQAANIKLKTLVQVNRQFITEKLLAEISLVVQKTTKKIEG